MNAYLRGQRVKVQVDYTHFHAEHTATGLDALPPRTRTACGPPFSWDSELSGHDSLTGRRRRRSPVSHCALWWYTFRPGDSG